MHERLLNQEPGIPLHQALAATLEEQIREGAWAVGSPIPPEVALCKLYSISRHTLRHALSTLEDGGLIVSAKVAHINQILPTVRQWIPHIRIISPEGLQAEMERGMQGYFCQPPRI